MEILIPNLEALPQAVNTFLNSIGQHKKIAFYGEVGAGKTTFINALCQYFNIRETVSSPTFSIINEYSYLDQNNVEQLIYHADLYRLKTIDEVIDIGFEDYLYDPHFCLVEWPNIAEPILPLDCLKIKMELDADSNRKIVFL